MGPRWEEVLNTSIFTFPATGLVMRLPMALFSKQGLPQGLRRPVTSPCYGGTWALEEKAAPGRAQTAGSWQKQMDFHPHNHQEIWRMRPVGLCRLVETLITKGSPFSARKRCPLGDVVPASQQMCAFSPGPPASPSVLIALPEPSEEGCCP